MLLFVPNNIQIQMYSKGIDVMQSSLNRPITTRDSFVKDILCSEFGLCTIEQSMHYMDYYKVYREEKLKLIKDYFNQLSLEWQNGNAREYLESLEAEIQYCIICHLMEDYINDKSSVK